MIVLRAAARSRFTSVSGFWVSQLLTESHIFLEKFSGHYYLSLGVHGNAGLFWQVEEFEVEGNMYFCLAPPGETVDDGNARGRLQFFCTQHVWGPAMAVNNEEYEGVPTKICFLV